MFGRFYVWFEYKTGGQRARCGIVFLKLIRCLSDFDIWSRPYRFRWPSLFLFDGMQNGKPFLFLRE